MEPETVALLGGLLFLLLALVGGGFTIREISMPNVPPWARVACLVVDAALVSLSVIRFGSDDTATTVRSPQPSPPSAPGETAVLYEDDGSYGSPEEIEVSGLLVTGEHEPATRGDQIRIEFSLANVGSDPITLGDTFIAVRDPAGNNEDFGEANEGKMFAPGEVITVNRSIRPDASGTWEFWPCYTVGDMLCPDEWQAFSIEVR